jgi:hypothetical protein
MHYLLWHCREQLEQREGRSYLSGTASKGDRNRASNVHFARCQGECGCIQTNSCQMVRTHNCCSSLYVSIYRSNGIAVWPNCLCATCSRFYEMVCNYRRNIFMHIDMACGYFRSQTRSTRKAHMTVMGPNISVNRTQIPLRGLCAGYLGR